MSQWMVAPAFILGSALASEALAAPAQQGRHPAPAQAYKSHQPGESVKPVRRNAGARKKAHNRHVYHYEHGWYRHARAGQRLPHDLRLYRYHLPAHGKIRYSGKGVTELIIAHQVIRILDATQTIISVTR